MGIDVCILYMPYSNNNGGKLLFPSVATMQQIETGPEDLAMRNNAAGVKGMKREMTV